MGTKLNPGAHDCYDKAEPDEPMFVLLARDELAPDLVRCWAELRGRRRGPDDPKVAEAFECAEAMERWAADHGDSTGIEAPRRCRACGCTDALACAGGCWWVEADLCSACAA